MGRQNRSRVEQARAEILALIEDAKSLSDGRLPSEQQIGQTLGVSRTTVRSALAALESEGIIHRRHGFGTFVNSVALKISTRLDHWVEFRQLIHRSGFESTVQLVDMKREPLSAEVAERLQVPPQTPGLVVRKLFLADRQPAILCSDMIPLSRLEGQEDLADLESQDAFLFLESRVLGMVQYGVSDVLPAIPDEETGRLLGVSQGTPLFVLASTAYGTGDQPIFASSEVYRPDLISFRVVRRRS